MDPVEERLAKPFYLKMMGLNALNSADRLWDDLVRAGRSATLAEVQQLLAPDHWRPVVMGAWFSLRFSADEVGADLLGAVGQCRGTLTAPPLSLAAYVILGRDAGRSLVDYIERDVLHQYGAAGFVSAVHESICGTSSDDVTDRDREAFRSMLDVALRFREALSDG